MKRISGIRSVALGAVGLAMALALGGASDTTLPTPGAAPLYEIRTYHIDPNRFPGYRTWAAEHGVAYLKANVDVVGFWVDAGIEPEVRGADTDPLGSANVTWIIRWDSKDARDRLLGEVLSTPEWRQVFAELPGGPENYLRLESRFMEEL